METLVTSPPPFFIIGCNASGTTAVVRILDLAPNATVYVEQPPKLCIEARHLHLGRLEDPEAVLREKAGTWPHDVMQNGKRVYGDKNPNYLLFIPYLRKLWAARFIFVIRDGREVVRSILSGRALARGGFFSMKEDDPASSVASADEDWWDYSRLRPRPGEQLHERWRDLSRFEKTCWYWAEFNRILIEKAQALPCEAYRIVHIDRNPVSAFERGYRFLGLAGFDAASVRRMISRRINSTKEKYDIAHDFPHYREWSAEQRSIFEKHAGERMAQLGYDCRWDK